MSSQSNVNFIIEKIQVKVLSYMLKRLEEERSNLDLMNKKIEEFKKYLDLTLNNVEYKKSVEQLQKYILEMKEAEQTSCNVGYSAVKASKDICSCYVKVRELKSRLSQFEDF